MRQFKRIGQVFNVGMPTLLSLALQVLSYLRSAACGSANIDSLLDMTKDAANAFSAIAECKKYEPIQVSCLLLSVICLDSVRDIDVEKALPRHSTRHF